jgi:PhzF family phenazine biosynthesis protein
MTAPIYQVDAFTSDVFGGNPAAVVPLGRWPEDRILQQIAAENNLSETAFFVGRGHFFELRWFTPALEVDLCGHATLATAHVLFEHLHYSKDIIQFKTLQHGVLKAFMNNGLITLDFPALPVQEIGCPEQLPRALGLDPVEVLESRDLLVVLRNEEEVANLQPDINSFKALPHLGIIVTARGDETDFVSRFFAPNAGIDEDPVTGSAHSTLTPFWSGRLHKKRLSARQLSARGGELICEYDNDRVLISGRAITYLKGEITW